MKNATFFTPSSTGLSGTQFASFNHDPEGTEKYSNTEQRFTSATRLFAPAVTGKSYSTLVLCMRAARIFK
jgi:hypothetical protein